LPCSSLHIGAILKNTSAEHMEAIFIKVNEMQKEAKGVPTPPSFPPFSTALNPFCREKPRSLYLNRGLHTVPTRSPFPGEIARNRLRLWNCYRVAYKNRLCSRDKSPHFTILRPFRSFYLCLSVCEKGGKLA